MATRRRAQSRTTSPLSPTSPTLDTNVKPAFPPTPATPGLPLLLKWSDLPSWQQDNHYILSHYRPASNSYLGSFQSLFYLHNESVNIHTHLLGAFLFFFMSFSIYAFDTRDISSEDIVAFACFFAGAVSALLAHVPFLWSTECSEASMAIARHANTKLVFLDSMSWYQRYIPHHIKSFPVGTTLGKSARLCGYCSSYYGEFRAKCFLWFLL